MSYSYHCVEHFLWSILIPSLQAGAAQFTKYTSGNLTNLSTVIGPLTSWGRPYSVQTLHCVRVLDRYGFKQHQIHIDIILQAVLCFFFFSVSNSLIVTVSHGNYNTVTLLVMINQLGLLVHWLAKFRIMFVLQPACCLFRNK